MRQSRDVRIGGLAEAAGVSVDTLRFYEREGLLPAVGRTAGGFRVYSRETAHRLEFIKQARELGLSVREIRQLVRPDNGRCSAVRKVLADTLVEVERRMRDLSAFRRTLKAALERCDETPKNAPCPVAKQLGT